MGCVFLVRRRLSGSVPGAGSFIRPNKTHDGRISFLHALQQKYSSSPEKYQEIVLESSGKQIEMIGFDKIEKQQSSVPPISLLQFCSPPHRRLVPIVVFEGSNVDGSNLGELTTVVLDSMLVGEADSYGEIARTCPRITDLDLSRNLICSLETVGNICAPLKCLKALRLTGNRFRNLGLETVDAFTGVEWLALNMCALRWDEVCIPDLGLRITAD